MDKAKLYFTRYFIDIFRKNYVKFEGRARREEYWFFALFSYIVSFILGLIDGLITPPEAAAASSFIDMPGPLGMLYTLAVFLPSLALLIRRLHDLNKSGWWALLGIVPVIGWIWLFILTVLPGTQGPNRFGEEPMPLAMQAQTAVETVDS